MRHSRIVPLVCVLIAVVRPADAQQPAAPATTAASASPAASDTAKPADTSAPAAAAPEARPSGESWVTGSVDLGYRWLSTPGGSFETYRSVINLGQGVRLVGLDLTITEPSRRWFDTINVRGSGWGGDPYSTFHFDAKKAGVYRLNVDYRGISYFNNLPAYADPLLASGITLEWEIRRIGRTVAERGR